MLYIKIYIYIYIYIYIGNSVKGYHRQPTYDELIQEAVIHPTETIKYPNRIATQLRNTPQLTRFDDESFLDMSTIKPNAMKQNIQQTAVQRALQPVARAIPSGLEQFDVAAGEEIPAIQEQVDERAASYERFKWQSATKRARLVSISEEELASQGQIDDMMALGSAAASLSGYDAGSSTTIVPVRVRTQEFEELTSSNLRGTPQVVGHRRTDSSTLTASAASAASAVSTATTVAIPKQPTKTSPNMYGLIEVAKERRRVWNRSDEDDKVQLSMGISNLMYQLGVLTNSKE